MSRLILPLVAISTLMVCTGWGIMFTRGGQNPFPAATPTPNTGTTIDQCTANLGTGVDLPLTLTVATNTDGSAEGLLLIHKGVTTGTDPNQMVLTSMDTFNNTWYNDVSEAATQGSGVNKTSAGCLNADWVPLSSGTGSDTVTAKSPGTGLLNAAVFCTVKNFAAYDVSGGTPYTAGTNVLTGAISPTISNELLAAMYYIDNGGSAATFTFSNLSSNSTITPGTPSDILFTGSSVSSSATAGQLLGAANETGIGANNSVGFQRSFSPTGNFCGGIIALTNAISSLTISPVNPPVNAGATQQFTATAVLPSGGTQNVLTGSPAWTSSNTTVATISNTGLATVSASAAVNSTTTITATYKGHTASTTLTVTVATAGAFPQFSRKSQILSSYTPGSSMWLHTMYDLSWASAASGQNLTIDAKAFSIDAWEDGNLWPLNLNPSGPFGCGQGASFSLSCYQTNFQSQLATYVSHFNSDGLPVLIRSDNLNDGSSGSWNGNTSYLGAAEIYSSQQFYSQTQSNGMFPAQMSQDEISGFNSDCTFGSLLDGLGLGFNGDPTPGFTQNNGTQPACPNWTPAAGVSKTPFNHVSWGADPIGGVPTFWFTNSWNGTAACAPGSANCGVSSDYAFIEASPQCHTYPCSSTANGVTVYHNADGIMNTINTSVRGPVPVSLLVNLDGEFYVKQSNNPPWNFKPGVDTLNTAGVTPAVSVASYWYAVAHGYAGIRSYEFDFQPFVNGRSQTGTGVTEEPVGSSPVSSFRIYGGVGQDRWYAATVAYNLISLLEPYILQPAMTAPTGCDSFPTNNAGNNIECGAKQGIVNGVNSRLVVIINFSDSAQNYTFNPASFWFGAGTTAQSWKIISGNDPTCGAQVSAYAHQITTADAGGFIPPYDCNRGETTINGVSPALTATGSNDFTLPAAGAAPTTTTVLAMQPLEVDVFLYHQ